MLMKDEFYKNILRMFTGTAISHLLWILSMLLVARLYTPEYFGEGQLFVSAASVLSIVATGRYEMAIVVPRYRFVAMNLLSFSSILSLCGAVAFGLILFYFSDAIVRFTGISSREICLLPFYVIELCLFVLFHAWLVREKKYTEIAKGLIYFPAAYLVLCYIFHLIWLPVHKLVLATVLARMVEILYYAFCMRESVQGYMDKLSLKSVWRHGKAYADFPKYMLIGSVIDSAAQHAVPFLVTKFWGMAATGYYSMARQALAAPEGLIAKSVGNVFRQEGSRLYGQWRECKDFYAKNLRLCVAYSAVICVCAYIAVPTIVPSFMGEKWIFAGYYVQLMLPMTFMNLIASTLSAMYVIARRQGSYLFIQAAYFIGSVVGIGVTGYADCSVETALLAWGGLAMIVSAVNIYGSKKIAEGSMSGGCK